MFLGHFGVGFGAKRIVPSVSLGTLFLAAQFADLLWPTLLLLGLEEVRIDPGITVVTPLDFVRYSTSSDRCLQTPRPSPGGRRPCGYWWRGGTG